MVGTADNLFSPNIPLTRGMVVIVLYRMQGVYPEVIYENPFNDVPEGQWYTEAVKWAAANKIVSGYGGGKFGPEDNITREQMAVMIFNYQKFNGKVPPDIIADKQFADWDEISGWAKSAVNVLAAQNIINGKPNGIFDPKGQATRAEFAALLHRAYDFNIISAEVN
jgi:hypothetical protein